jgi:hypothetical protein
MESKCPYKHLIPNDSSNETKTETSNMYSETVESNIADPKKCPEEIKSHIDHILKNPSKAMGIANNNDEEEVVDTNQITKPDAPKCPFKAAEMNKDEDEDEDASMGGGCPVRYPKELNSNFDYYYEIPFYDKNDFYFEIMGKHDQKEFNELTKWVKTLPRHLRHSLFLTKDPQLTKVHEKDDFTIIYFVFEELRQKANKFYRKAQFRPFIFNYYFAYACFRWLSFKDEDRNKVGIINSQSLQAILDEDIELKRCKTDESIPLEEATWRGALVTILKALSFSYMHLRHYGEAIICLNEAIEISNSKTAELYLRRSQARMYNKSASLDDLQIALDDIHRAKMIDPEEKRFDDHLKILNDYIEEKKSNEEELWIRLLSSINYAFNKIKEKNLNVDDYVYPNYEGTETHMETLEDMKSKYHYAIKFHTECNNAKQVQIAYREFDNFMDIYSKFKWYFALDLVKIPKNILKNEDK